jgi:ectoine hydroxylase-related dioxygenase (phytanoyl-CoA dioxygenase family)
MVTLRIHLDDCGAESGPLEVVPRSHLAGRIPEASISDLIRGAKVCAARAGDVLAFKPLLLHASASAKNVGHRRVLQIEFASEELPGGLTWRWRA